MKSATLCRTTMTRTNWRASKTTTPPPNMQSCSSTIRPTTALCKRCCCLSSKPTETTTTMTHHPLLSASRPMGAMQQPRQTPLSTIQSMGATPPWHRPLLLACRPMGAICRRKEMSRTLAPMPTKWVPLAMAPRLPLAYLLCDNQLFFQFSDEELRELGSRRRQLPRYEMRRAFPPGLEGERGRPHGRTVPRLLGMHWSQGTPLHPQGSTRRVGRGTLCCPREGGGRGHPRRRRWRWKATRRDGGCYL
jgi:hypothetical protein